MVVLVKTLSEPTALISPTPSATELAEALERGKATDLLCVCVGKEVARAGHCSAKLDMFKLKPSTYCSFQYMRIKAKGIIIYLCSPNSVLGT